jgi:hypothetical protein
MIFVDNVPADKLREQLQTYNPNKIIAVTVSRYVGGWALFYQIIYKK